ncbi:B12-binding domain-containing radical SAM protein [Streptomyces prunicolor]|uniref:B12-binding domain-containing radical SAM protein n=1 Tax=Streptomyces prunicolor TaxID=67348 RepID=UPI003716A141
MRVLLLSGLGPAYMNSLYLRDSLFERHWNERAEEVVRRAGCPGISLENLFFTQGGRRHALLRPQRTTIPHLTTFTLNSILQNSGHEFISMDLQDVWQKKAEAPPGDFDVVLLSTTYIWNATILGSVMRWLGEQLPGVAVLVGGQYTNLKFMQVMSAHPEIIAVVRGDGEEALPRTLDALAHGGGFAGIPNAVWRDGDRVRINPVEYVDIDAFPSPGFPGTAPVIPYESMRGCPFDCKFCSFPAASPKWRYKSAEKIRDDWLSYGNDSGARMISAMDSTFTIPPTRMRRLMEILPGSGVPHWEGFSRANTIDSSELVDGLAKSNCTQLHIGFESMNDAVLKRMSKRVTVKQNRRAMDLLSRSELSYHIFFIVGYPSETPEMFRDTADYLVDDYVGYFQLSRFSITDETMPLWQDREELRITADDPSDPASAWSHIGMDSAQADRLQAETLDRVRLHNDKAVYHLWQRPYQHWLMPDHDRWTNIAVEKCVERLAMAPRDYDSLDRAAHEVRVQLARLRELGVELSPHGRELCRDAL